MNVKFGITTIIIGGLVGLNVYGASTFIFFTIMYTILSGVDIFLGWYIAKRNGDVNSSRFREGVVKKNIGLVIILITALLSWHISYITDSEYIGYIGLFFPVGYTVSELMSILENYLLLNGSAYENRWVRIMLKVLGMGVDTVDKKIIDTVNNLSNKNK